MRFRHAVAVALLALGISGCVSVKQPVGTNAGFANDPGLEGLWAGRPAANKPLAYYHVIANADRTKTVIVVVEPHGDDKAVWGTLSLTTAALGGHRYMNIVQTSEDGKPKAADPADGNIALLYSVSADALSISEFDLNKVTAAIDAHRIDGVVDRDTNGIAISAAITADAAHLDAWLAQPDAANLFAPLMVLHRVK